MAKWGVWFAVVLISAASAMAQTILRPSSAAAAEGGSNGFWYPALAFDGDMTTPSTASPVCEAYGSESLWEIWQGFPQAPPHDSLVLKVRSQVRHEGTRVSARLYWTDNSGTPYNIYSVNNLDRAEQTDTIILPPTFDTTKLGVSALVTCAARDAYAWGEMNIYEIWVEVY